MSGHACRLTEKSRRVLWRAPRPLPLRASAASAAKLCCLPRGPLVDRWPRRLRRPEPKVGLRLPGRTLTARLARAARARGLVVGRILSSAIAARRPPAAGGGGARSNIDGSGHGGRQRPGRPAAPAALAAFAAALDYPQCQQNVARPSGLRLPGAAPISAVFLSLSGGISSMAAAPPRPVPDGSSRAGGRTGRHEAAEPCTEPA